MNILNSGRFGVGAGAGGGLRKLIGIKNRKNKNKSIDQFIHNFINAFLLF